MAATDTNTSLPLQIRILRLKDVENCTGLKRPSIYRLMAQGQFPKQVALSTRSVGWVEQTILDWLQARITAANLKNNQSQS